MEPVGPGPSSLHQGCRRRWGPAPCICSGCMTNATDCSLNHRRSPFPAAHTLRRPAATQLWPGLEPRRGCRGRLCPHGIVPVCALISSYKDPTHMGLGPP